MVSNEIYMSGKVVRQSGMLLMYVVEPYEPLHEKTGCNREADQHLCFRYTDSTIPLLSESEISSF